MSLPAPADLAGRAVELADDGAEPDRVADADVLNVVVAGAETGAPDGFDPDAVALADDGYEGPEATTAANLAAAVDAIDGREDACLHYPGATMTAAGPWVVLEPLGGRVATVHAGRGRVAVDVAGDPHAALPRLLDAATPTHEHYPVADDDLGVFRSGMEVATLRRVDAGREHGFDAGDTPGARAVFEVRVLPTTTPAGVEARFAAVDGVADAEFSVVTGVERAAPPVGLREAVERAHVAVRGDCEYEWSPEPTVFSHLPTAEKVALGAAMPDADGVGAETVETTADLLGRTVENRTDLLESPSTTGVAE